VVGGLLVTLAALLAWWAAAGSGRATARPVVVAARDLGPGHHLEPADLRVVDLDVTGSVRTRSFESPAQLRRAVTLGPIGAGEIVQAANVAPAAGRDLASRAELSFAVEPDAAVAGTLRLGDRVDVYATYGTGPGATTVRVLEGATIRGIVDGSGEQLGQQRAQTVTVALGSDTNAAEVVNATRAAAVTLVRTTGGPSAPGTDRFRVTEPTDGSPTATETGPTPSTELGP
jgi:Flp pilus assembly protein CpaB